MRTNNYIIVLILGIYGPVIAILAGYLIIAGWKRKLFPEGGPGQASAILLAGQFLSAALLLFAALFPIRDYLAIAATTGQADLFSPAFWGLAIVAAVTVGIAYLAGFLLARLITGSVYSGKNLTVELREQNTGAALLYAVLTFAFALVLCLPVIVCVQAFIPTPAIPNIH